MSEEGGFIDVESDEVPELGGEATASTSENAKDPMAQEYHSDKRAHHNLLERRRRDHIKDSFYGLRDCIPSLQGEKVSRAHILNKATEYIRQMQRGGSLRENEITELKKKNEILEEQVKVIEQNKAIGSNQKIEEVLEMVAKDVQVRQQQRDHNDQSVQGSSRSEKQVLDLSGQDLARSLTMATRTTPTTVGSGVDIKKLDTSPQPPTSNALSLLQLAGNLKSAQALITALKSLPNANLANVKNLASKALSSTAALRQTPPSASSSPSLPRGIVTATTVPKGSSLPLSLASALQQKPPASANKSIAMSQLANHLTSQIKPTTTTATPLSQQQQQQQQSSSPKPATSSLAPTSTPSSSSSTSLEGDTSLAKLSPSPNNKSATIQALEVSTLLQQQGSSVGDITKASGAITQLTAEIIAQCLSLPNSTGPAVTSSSMMSSSSSSASSDDVAKDESNEGVEPVVAMSTADATVSAANVLAALGSLSQESSSHIKPQPASITPPPSHTLTPTHTPLTPPAQSETSAKHEREEEGEEEEEEGEREMGQDSPPHSKKPRLEDSLL